jgi:hypothetical protein
MTAKLMKVYILTKMLLATSLSLHPIGLELAKMIQYVEFEKRAFDDEDGIEEDEYYALRPSGTRAADFCLKEANGCKRPQLTQVASVCSVSRNFVRKIQNELVVHGRVLHPKELQQDRIIGPGARTLDELDSFVLLLLYLVEESWTLPNHTEHLFLLTGTQVSESTISRLNLNH